MNSGPLRWYFVALLAACAIGGVLLGSIEAANGNLHPFVGVFLFVAVAVSAYMAFELMYPYGPEPEEEKENE